MDTIFALATAAGKSGVAVIRISGSQAFEAARALCGDVPPPRLASLRQLKDGSGAVLDEALVLTFAPGHSFTGEAVVELQTHGSLAVIGAVLRVLSTLPGLRAAEAGEFTHRALDNGRLDLTQVEALADLIEAETEAQRQQAQRLFAGAFGFKVDVWRKDLIRAASLLEAVIDFADEDVPVDVTPEVMDLLQRVAHSVGQELQGFSGAERLRHGFEVAIVGAPNVGKSTLLNALAGRDAAITSEIAGTTRDVIEVRMDLGGVPVTLLDTAGIRDSDDIIEKIGVTRAIERAMKADLRIVLLEADHDLELELCPDDIVLNAKSDFPGDPSGISGKTGNGVNTLIQRVTDVFSARVAGVGLASRERHRVAMSGALSQIEVVRGELSKGTDAYDLAADDLRVAIRRLESLIGRVDVENMLDEIFSSFCIGK